MTSTTSPAYRLTDSGAKVLSSSSSQDVVPETPQEDDAVTKPEGAATSLSPPPLNLAGDDREMTPDSPVLLWGSPAKHMQRRDPVGKIEPPAPTGTRRNPSRRVKQQVIAKRHPCYHQQRRAGGGPAPLCIIVLGKRELTSTAAKALDDLVCHERMP